MQRRVIDHGVRHAHALYAVYHTLCCGLVGVNAECQREVVLEHPRLCHGTSAEGLVVRIAYDALSVYVVEADVIVRSVVASAHRKVVAVRDACTLHLLLPVRIGTFVAGQREVVGFGVVSEVVGSGQLYVLSHIVYSHISVVADMCRAALVRFLASCLLWRRAARQCSQCRQRRRVRGQRPECRPLYNKVAWHRLRAMWMHREV